MTALDAWISHILPWIPRPIVWKVARRYIAGITLDDAVKAIGRLRDLGIRATVDVLGENVETRSQILEARNAYLAVLERLHSERLPAGISVKLTQLGLKIDPGLALENLETLVSQAAGIGRFVRIDMEDSTTTDATIAIYKSLCTKHNNLGMVLQAYLRRTIEDTRALVPLKPDIRLCKGIYSEPESISYHGVEEIRENFLRAIEILFHGDAKVALATHDSSLIEEGFRIGKELDPGFKRHEFQMLFGVGERMWSRILKSGRRLRIYVPFGANWYAYSLRRLRENPKIAGYVFRNLLKRAV